MQRVFPIIMQYISPLLFSQDRVFEFCSWSKILSYKKSLYTRRKFAKNFCNWNSYFSDDDDNSHNISSIQKLFNGHDIAQFKYTLVKHVKCNVIVQNYFSFSQWLTRIARISLIHIIQKVSHCYYLKNSSEIEILLYYLSCAYYAIIFAI